MAVILLFGQMCGGLNGFAYTGVGAAAADMALHGIVDVRIGGVRRAFEQGGGRHDLAALAVAALGHLPGDPRFLYGV